MTRPERAVAGLADLGVGRTGTSRWRRPNNKSGRSSRVTCSTARARWPTAAPAACSPTWTRRTASASGELRIRKRAESISSTSATTACSSSQASSVWPRVVAVVDPAWPPTVRSLPPAGSRRRGTRALGGAAGARGASWGAPRRRARRPRRAVVDDRPHPPGSACPHGRGVGAPVGPRREAELGSGSAPAAASPLHALPGESDHVVAAREPASMFRTSSVSKARAPGATDWLDALPDLVAELERRWSITVGAPFDGAHRGVRRRGRPPPTARRPC